MTIGDLLEITLKNKAKLLVRVVVVAVIGLLAWLLFPEEYVSNAIVAPRQTHSSATSGIVSGGSFGNLFFGGSMSFEAWQSVRMLTSNLVLSKLAQDPTVLSHLYPKEYDPESMSWRERRFGKSPGIEERVEAIRSLVTLRPDAEAGVVGLSLTTDDPVTSQVCLKGLIDTANESLRAIAIEESSRHLEAIEEESTAYAFLQEVMGRIAEKEMETLILAKSNPDYGLKILDPPTLPEQAKKLPVFVLPLILILLAFVWTVWSEYKKTDVASN